MEPTLSLLPANTASILGVVAFASIRLSFSRAACLLPKKRFPSEVKGPVAIAFAFSKVDTRSCQIGLGG